jgi:hypothetical protein
VKREKKNEQGNKKKKKTPKSVGLLLLFLGRGKEIQLGAKHIPAASKFDQEREKEIEEMYL